MTMKQYKIYLLSILMFLAFSSFSADTQKTSKRFYAGNVIRAEVKPDNPELPIVVRNVSEFEPKSLISSDVGYAVVTVNLDPGRSLGLYDYSLVNPQKREFPCISLAERENDFDQEKWELIKTRPSKKYTMLFQVQLPPMGQAKYDLRFKLKKGLKDIPLEFINVGSKPFTYYKDIPGEGILGIDPNKPKPVEQPVIQPEEKKTDADAAAPAAAKPAEKAPDKKLSKAEQKRKNDQEAWTKMMGDKPAEKKESKPAAPAKKEKKSKDKDKGKGKTDAWDDWK